MRHSWWGILFLVALVGVVYLLDAVLMPFIAGLILAYLADPLTNYFQRLGLKRVWAVSSVFLILLLVLAISLLILIPLVIQQIKQLGEMVPGVFDWVENYLAPQVQEWTGYDLRSELNNVQETLAENWRDAGSYLAQALGQIGRSGMAFATWVTYVALIPVVTFYLLLDWNRLLNNLIDLIPRHWVDDATRLAKRCDEVLAAFLRGQLLVMLCLGVIYAVGLTLMGLNFGLLIGVISGLVSIVPFLGFIVGLSSALVVALFQWGVGADFWTLIVAYLVVQGLDGNLLVPILFSEAVNLHPLVIILAVIVFGGMWGFWGVFFAIPLATLVKAVIHAWPDELRVEVEDKAG